MSRLTRVSVLLAFFFGLDKGMAFLRSIIIARQFGLSKELDAFNVANNVPDLLFALISGGALAMAFIPVLAETRTREGQSKAWELFSRIANLAFITTAGLAIVVALLAGPIVRSRFGIAPGFSFEQQNLVIHLMQLNLIATLIFSISGLVMAGLQANQHFLLPAMAPMLYNLGQIFGAVVLAPEKGYHIGGLTLPAFGLGVQGLVYGVILGAVLHLVIQLPGLALNHFRWTPAIGLFTRPVLKVLSLMGPRLITMLMIQFIFLVRDNRASLLMKDGAVTSLTYGWMIMQVPETLIGTAIGIALLPTLAELVALDEKENFHSTVQRAMQVIIAITLPIAVVLMVGLPPLLSAAFHFGAEGTAMLVWVTRGFLVGLTGQCLMELAVRSFYARQDAITPMITAVINFGVYFVLVVLLSRWLGVPGISLADSLAFTSQAILLLVLLNRGLIQRLSPGWSVWRAIASAIIGGAAVFAVSSLPQAARQPLLMAVMALGAGGFVALLPIIKEIRLLLRL
jgi:putative peptidoglycan lipid II flippase